MDRTSGISFAEELAELTDEISVSEKGVELDEARRKAAKLSADQWHLLKQAARSPDGRIQVTLPALVAPARALTALGLGEYFPPPEIGTTATFSISRKGRELKGADG